MLKLSAEMKVTSELDRVTAMCREGWVVTSRPINVPGASWMLRRLEPETEADRAVLKEVLADAAERDYMHVSIPRDYFDRQLAEAHAPDNARVCVFEHARADGEVVGWRMCWVYGEDFLS